MCVASMISDHYLDKWKWLGPVPDPWYQPFMPIPQFPPLPSPEQLEQFRRDVEEFRKLIERAKEYDRHRGEPDCELEVKREAIKRIARQMGVEITFA